MANRKRPSPTLAEIEDTIEPAISNNFPGVDLTNKEDFDKAWNNYFQDKELIQSSVKTMNTAYDVHLFRQAGGKDLEKDRRTLAKETVSTPERYIRRGSQRVDLPGVDTPFSYSGIRKGKRVIAKRDKVIIKGKTYTRFRDKKGRFVKA